MHLPSVVSAAFGHSDRKGNSKAAKRSCKYFMKPLLKAHKVSPHHSTAHLPWSRFVSLLASVSSRQKWSLPQDKFPRLWLWQGYCTHFMGSVDTVRLIKPGHLFFQGTPNELIFSFHYPSTHMHTIMSSNNRTNFLSILIILFLFQNIVHWLEV